MCGCCQLVVSDKLLFTDDNFDLMPVEGEIWPGSTAAVTVVFRPTEPKHYQQVSIDITSVFIATSLSEVVILSSAHCSCRSHVHRPV